MLLVAADYAVGSLMQTLYRRTPPGVNWTQANWLLSHPHDVVILGSSRAFRHYVPEVISDRLGVSVFNAGQNGQYLLYAYAVEQLMLDEYAPDLVVLDVLPSFLVEMQNPDEEFERLEALSPFYDHPTVQQLLTRGKLYEKMKYASKIYRFNSKILSLLDNFRESPKNMDNGFERVGKVNYHETNPFIVDMMEEVRPDSFKIQILHDFITSAQQRGVQVVLSLSPISEPLSPRVEKLVTDFEDICRAHQIPFLNFTDSHHLDLMQQDYFMDYIHMDEPGARQFSRRFAERLVPFLPEQKTPVVADDARGSQTQAGATMRD